MNQLFDAQTSLTHLDNLSSIIFINSLFLLKKVNKVIINEDFIVMD